jgi:hypothetical protein
MSDWCAPTPNPQSPPRLSDKDLETAGASGGFNALSEAAKWEARRLLNDKLRRYPNLKSGNALAQSFADNWDSKSPGRFAQVENQIRQAYAIQPTHQASMDNLSAQRQTLRQQLAALEAGANQPQDPSGYDPTVAAAKEAIFVQLSQVHDQTAALKQQIRTQQVNALRAALFANAQLPAAQVYESNRRLLNKLALTLALKGTLEPAEFQQLKDLAGSTQPNAGYAAQEAKWLLPHCESSAARPRREGRSRAPKMEQEADGMQAYPNPAGDQITLLLPQGEVGAVTIFDLRGQAYGTLQKAGELGSLSIPTASLPNGTYMIQFRSSVTGKAWVLKAAVQH